MHYTPCINTRISVSLRRPIPSRRTCFPYTTLFRSVRLEGLGGPNAHAAARWAVGLAATHPRDPPRPPADRRHARSEEHTSELQSLTNIVCRLRLEKKKIQLGAQVLDVVGSDRDSAA